MHCFIKIGVVFQIEGKDIIKYTYYLNKFERSS